MIINHLYFISIAVSPFKANAILIVDAYAMLASPITRKLLQPMAGNREILQGLREMEPIEPHARDPLYR